MIDGSDTERRSVRDAATDRDAQAGRASIGAFLYCLTTGLGIGAFCGEPLTGTLIGTLVGYPAAVWVMPAAVRERRDPWRDR